MSIYLASTLSRRQCLRIGGGLVTFISALGRTAATGPLTRLKLVHEIKQSFLCAVSADSQKLCLCSTARPIGQFTIEALRKRRAVDYLAPGPYKIRVVEFGSWKELFSAPLDHEPARFGFSPDSQSLLGEDVRSMPVFQGRWILVDLRTGKMESKIAEKPGTSYTVLRDGILAGGDDRGDLVQAQWPTFREILRVAVPGAAGVLRFNADRTKVLQRANQWLVCYRVSDFKTLWKRQIDPDIDFTIHWNDNPLMGSIAMADYAISADGNIAALAPTRASYRGKPGKSYVEILSGTDGSPLSRWSGSQHDSMVLSQDGRLLALGEVSENSMRGDIEPTAHLYAIPSGREVAAIVHDRMPPENRLNSSLAGGIDFTNDGKYFITSADNSIKVWRFTSA